MHKKNRANQSIFYHDVVTQHVLTVIMHHFALTNLLKRESPFFSGVERKSRTAREQKRALQGHKTTALMAALKKAKKDDALFLRLFFSRSDNDLCSLIWSL